MKTLTTAILALTPAAAMAHGTGAHIHPHGAEYTIAALVVIGAAGLFWMARR